MVSMQGAGRTYWQASAISASDALRIQGFECEQSLGHPGTSVS